MTTTTASPRAARRSPGLALALALVAVVALAGCAGRGGMATPRVTPLPVPLSPAHAHRAAPFAAQLVVGIDVEALRRSALWARFMTPLLSTPDLVLPLAMVKRDCGFAPVESVRWVALALESYAQGARVVMFVGTTFGPAELDRCLAQVAATSGVPPFSSSRGKVTTITGEGGEIHAGWIDERTLFFSDAGIDGNREAFEAELAAVGTVPPLSDVDRLVRAVDTTADVWLAGRGDATADEDGMPGAEGLWATLRLPADVALDVDMRFADEAQARQALAAVRKDLGPEMADLAAAGGTITTEQHGRDVVMKVRMTAAFVDQVLEMFGPAIWQAVEGWASEL